MMLTEKQAYAAMAMFLRQYFERGQSEEIALILHHMMILEDGEPYDPAYWDDWLKSVQQVVDASKTEDNWREFVHNNLAWWFERPDKTVARHKPDW
jgi:hypothetical protein